MLSRIFVLAVLISLSMATNAMAQVVPVGDPPPVAEAEVPEGRAPIAKKVEEPESTGEDVKARAVKADDESIYVVQRRAYSKGGKLELTPMFFRSMNNKFVGHYGGAIAAAYHLKENFALELTTSLPMLTKSFYSSLVYDVKQYVTPPLEPEAVDLKTMTYFASLSMQFSAFYGKLIFYGLNIDYDFYATVGAGFVSTVETCAPPNQDGCSEDTAFIGRGTRPPELGSDRYKFSGNLGGGMRIYFSDVLGLRMEVRDIVYSDRGAESGKIASQSGVITTDIRNNVLMFLGLSFLI